MSCFNDRATIIYIPRYVNRLESSVENPKFDPIPRCAINVGEVLVSDIFDNTVASLTINGASSSSVVTEVPYIYSHNTETGIGEVDSIKQGLSFGDPYFPKFQNNLKDTY